MRNKLLILICLCIPFSLAAQIDYSNTTGFPENGVFHGGPVDTVSINGGNLHIEFPIWRAKGRGIDTWAKFVYDSKTIQIDSSCDNYGYCTANVRGDTLPQLHVITSESVALGSDGISGWCDGTTPDAMPVQYYGSTFVLTDENGTRHHFVPAEYVVSNTCGYSTPSRLYADDGSGWALVPNSSGVMVPIRKDGTSYNPDTVDTNGNKISLVSQTLGGPTIINNYSDTVGRSFSSDGAFVDVNGTSHSAPSVTKSGVNVQSNLCGYVPVPHQSVFFTCSEISGTFQLPTSISFPTGQTYTFQYTSNGLGEPASMVLPTGGTIAWTWTDDNQAGRRVASRTVDGNTWAYDAYGGKITNPDGSYITFGYRPDQNGRLYEESRTYWEANGQAKRNIQTQYAEFSKTTYNYDVLLPSVITTKLMDTSEVSKVETDYESYTFTTPTLSFPITWGNPTEVREFAWGTNAAGALLRKTHYGYKHEATPAYLTANIANRVTTKVVYDGSGAIASQTTTNYDEVSTTDTSASNVPGHDYNAYGTGNNLRGNPTSVQVWSDTEAAWLTTHYTYDDLGNRLSAQDPGLHTTTYIYDDKPYGACPPSRNTKAYLTQTTNVLGQRAQNHYYYCNGLIAQTQDENDLSSSRAGTLYSYDQLNRPLSVQTADGGGSTYSYPDWTHVNQQTKLTTSNSLNRTTVLDDLGRLFETLVTSDPAGTVFSETRYDSLGRVNSVSNPYHAGDALYWTSYQYDSLGRTTLITKQDGNTQKTDYVGSKVTVTDEAGNKRSYQNDALGRMTDVWEDPAGLNYHTLYNYDALGNLTGVTQNGSRQRTFHYDSLGNLTYSYNPEAGATTYAYTYGAGCNPDRLLQSKTDAKGQTITYCYDALGRLTYATSGGQYLEIRQYDQTSMWGNNLQNSIGRLTYLTTGELDSNGQYASQKIYSYDPMGRVLLQGECSPYSCGSTGWSINATYNFDGSLNTLNYPSGRNLKYQYDSAGHLTNVNFPTFYSTPVNYTYYSASAFWPNGQVMGDTLGNGLGEYFGQNSRLQATEFKVSGTSPTVFEDLKPCMYDGGLSTDCVDSGHNNGNVIAIRDVLQSNRNQRFNYDTLNRLTSASQDDPAGWGQAFTIDAWGNLSNITTQKGSLPSLNCPADTNNRLTTCFGYDLNGNVTSNGSTQYQYDAKNQLINVGNQSPKMYTYDADGMRIYKNVAGDKTTYVYFGGQPIAEAHETPTGLDWSDYIYAGSRRVAKADTFDHSIHIEGTNCTSCGWQATGFSFSNAGGLMGYVIQPGDKFYISQMQPNQGRGGFAITFTDGTNTAWGVAHDQNGYQTNDLPLSNGGTWYVRTIDLTPTAGRVVSDISLIAEGTTPAGVTWDIYFEQIALVGADGTVHTIYDRGPLPVLGIWNYPGVTNIAYGDDHWQGSGNAPFTSTVYYHGDQIGSARMISSSGGYPVWQGTYTPFGYEVNAQVTPNHYKFTGKEHDTETGLDYFGARYYGSSLARFMSPDPESAGSDPENPQSWNGYAYVLNSPATLTDPLGLAPCTPDQERAGKCTDVVAPAPTAITVVNLAVDTMLIGVRQGGRFIFDHLPSLPHVDFGPPGCMTSRGFAGGAIGGGTGLAVGLAGAGVGEIVTAPGGAAVGALTGGLSCMSVAGSGGGPAQSSTGGSKLSAAVKKKLGALVDRAGEKVADVIRSRGGTGSNVNEAGEWAQQTLAVTAKAAVEGSESAETAIKICKQAARLGQKY